MTREPRLATVHAAPYVLAALALAAFAPWNFDNHDLCFHLAAGRHIVGHRALPLEDPFSFLNPGVAWVNPEWLFQVGAYLAWWAGGLGALLAAKALLLAATAALLVGAAGRLGAPEGAPRRRVLAAALLTLAAPACVERLTLRPHLFGFLFLAYTLYAAARAGAAIHAARPRAAWAWAASLLPVHALWTNVHGSALLGAAVLFALACRAHGLLPLLAAALAAPLAWMLNPWGAEVVAWPLEHAAGSDVYRALLTEWRPPFAGTPDVLRVTFAAWLGLAPAFLLGAAWVRSPAFARAGAVLRHHGAVKTTPASLPLLGAAIALAAAGFLALQSVRFTADFVLLAAAFGAACADEVLAAARRTALLAPRRAAAAAVAFALAATTLALAAASGVHGWPAVEDRPREPAAVADFLAASGWSGRLFNGPNVGPYLMMHAGPGVSVYLDARALHGHERLEQFYTTVLPSPALFESEVERHAVGAALCELGDPNFAALCRHLDAAPARWTLVHLDPDFALYLRTGEGAPAGNNALAARTRLLALRPIAGLGYLLGPGVSREAVRADAARLAGDRRGRPLALAALAVLDLAEAALPPAGLASPPSSHPALLRALAGLDEAVRLRPDVASFLYFDGLALAHAGRLDAAVAPLEEAARLEPRTPHVWIALNWVAAARGDSAGAAAARLRAGELLPPGHPALTTLY